jgi:hypothetical protein
MDESDGGKKMIAVELQARVENGSILIPEEYKQVIADCNTVTVQVTQPSKKKISETGILAQLAINPVPVTGIRTITRDEMHDRSL